MFLLVTYVDARDTLLCHSFILITRYQANPLARFINNFIIIKRIKWVTEAVSSIFN